MDSKANLLKCYHDLGSADQNGVGRIGDTGEEIITGPFKALRQIKEGDRVKPMSEEEKKAAQA